MAIVHSCGIGPQLCRDLEPLSTPLCVHWNGAEGGEENLPRAGERRPPSRPSPSPYRPAPRNVINQ